MASGASYGSGLPFEYSGDVVDALTAYGPEMIHRINFERGRILPSLSASMSLGAEIYKSERMAINFQAMVRI